MSADAKDHRSSLDVVSQLLAALPLPAFVVDAEHRVHYLNRAARQRVPELGEGEESPCYTRVFRRDAPCELCVMSEVLADGADEVLCSQELAGQQLRTTGMRFEGDHGTPYVAEIVHMGGEGLVSNRSSTEQREDAMHSVIDSSNEVVLLFDAQYRAVIANRLAKQNLGYTAAELAELTLLDLGVANSTEELGQILSKADGGMPATARAVIVSKQGGKIPVKVSLSLLVGSSTRVVGACTFAAPRLSNTALPAMQRSASGPLPKPGLSKPSGPVPKPGQASRPAPPSKPKPPARPASPEAAPKAKTSGSGSAPSGSKRAAPVKPAPASPAAKGSESGRARISQSLEAMAGDLESESTVLKKADEEKRGKKPKAPPPTPGDLDAEILELEAELLEVAESEGQAAPPPPPASKSPPKAAKPPATPAAKAPPLSAKPPAKPAPKPPAKPAPKPPAKPAPKPPAKPAPKPPAKSAPKPPAKPAPKPPAKPAPKLVPAGEVTVQVVAEPSVVAAASEGIESLLGYPPTEVVTWSAQDWFTRVHEPQLAQDLENMWAGLVGQVFEPGALPDQIMEYPLVRKDGSVVDCATTWRAVQAADGKFEGLEVVIKPKG